MPTADNRAAFDLALRLGELSERALARVLTGAGDVVRIEAKTAGSSITHVFVEYAEGQRPSGIAVTTSDYYAVEVGCDRWVMVRTADLMRMVSRAVMAYGERRGGHGGRARGAIVPKVWLVGLDTPRGAEPGRPATPGGASR